MTFLILTHPFSFSEGGVEGSGICSARGFGDGGVRCEVLKMRDVIS